MADKLPKARKRYYIDEPVVVLPLAEVERLTEHLIRMGLYQNQPANVRAGLDQRQKLLLNDLRGKIKGARRHYNIKDPARRMSETIAGELLNQQADELLSE